MFDGDDKHPDIYVIYRNVHSNVWSLPPALPLVAPRFPCMFPGVSQLSVPRAILIPKKGRGKTYFKTDLFYAFVRKANLFSKCAMSGWDGWRGEETGRWLPLGPPAPPASPSSHSALGWSPGLTQGTSLQTSECGNIVYSGAPRKDALLPEQMFTNANGQWAHPHQAPAPPSSTCWEGQDVCTPSGPMMLRSPEAALWRCQPSLALWHQHVGLSPILPLVPP